MESRTGSWQIKYNDFEMTGRLRERDEWFKIHSLTHSQSLRFTRLTFLIVHEQLLSCPIITLFLLRCEVLLSRLSAIPPFTNRCYSYRVWNFIGSIQEMIHRSRVKILWNIMKYLSDIYVKIKIEKNNFAKVSANLDGSENNFVGPSK